MHQPVYRRDIEPRLKDALNDTPVALLQGPRQCGKTTLARQVGEAAGHHYFTFDDENTRRHAVSDPAGFVRALPDKVILDEVQRAPNLFTSIKLSVDNDRRPGRFILTGSMRVLQFGRINDSLAGRMEILRLHPLSQIELARRPAQFLDALFAPDFTMRQAPPGPPQPLIARVAAGGYPAALRRSAAARWRWHRSYIAAIVERDAPDLAAIGALRALPELLKLAAARTGQLLNVNALADSFQLTQRTIDNYLTLLGKLFLVERLPAWHSNHTKRLAKTPKLHLTDTGVAGALLGLNEAGMLRDRVRFGQLLETFVLQELRRQASAHIEPHDFYHFRDKDRQRAEVDIVLRRGADELVGVEVKAAATVTPADFKGLRKLRDAAGDRFICGALLHTGGSTLPCGDRLWALPLHRLWGAE